MRIIFTTSAILFLLTFLAPMTCHAEEYEIVNTEQTTTQITEDVEKRRTTSINKYFELELQFDSQNPLNKNIRYTLVITPRIDSPQTQITWDLPTTLTGSSKHREFVDLQKDQTYSYDIVISPQREGVYDVTANVTSWQNEVNYTNSVSTTVTLDKSLVAQPVDSSYQVTLILFIVGILLIIIVLGYVGLRVSKVVLKRLRVWLTPPY